MSVNFFSLTYFTSLASGDVMAMIDVSDTTQSPQGSTDAITVTNFFATIPVPVNVTSASATALAVGRQGATSPAFVVDASTASSATGIKVTAAAAAGGVALAAISSGTDENLTVDAKGAGTVTIAGTSTGGISLARATTAALGLTITSGQTLTLTGATVAGQPTWSSSQAITISTATQASITTMANLTTVGTIGTGVWQGTAVAATFGGTAQTSWTTGDLLYASGTNTLAKRAIGSSGDVLTVSGGVPSWVAPGTTFTTKIQTTLTTEQMRIRYDASNYVAVTVSATSGVLIDDVASGTPVIQFGIGGSVIVGIGATGLSLANSTLLTTAASVAARAGFRMPSGTAPTSPTSGDFWYDGTNLKFRDGSTTRTVTWT